MKAPSQSQLNQWKAFYFLGALLFFVFTLFFIFLQNQNVRHVYLNTHANELEYQKEYSNALRIWKKLYERNPEQPAYLIKIIQNYFLQENYEAILKTIQEQNIANLNQDTLLIFLKYGLLSAQKLNQKNLTQEYIEKINNVLNIKVYWNEKSSKWVYIDDSFTIGKLKKWVDAMYTLIEQEISIYIILKDLETSFYYLSGIVSFNKRLFIENEIYESSPFTKLSRINPSDFNLFLNSNKAGFLWFTLKKIQFENRIWLNHLKSELNIMQASNIFQFLKEAKVIVPISYNNQNYNINEDYMNLPKEICLILIDKLKTIKNKQELEKLSNIFYFCSKK